MDEPLRAVARASTRDDAIGAYARALNDPMTDWLELNQAIIERWSLSALSYIKKRAWKVRGDA